MSKSTPSKLTGYEPTLFPWYENHVQDSLQKVAEVEGKAPQRLVEIMAQIRGSHHFWTMFSCFEDHQERMKDTERDMDPMLALLARFYAAGMFDKSGHLESD